MQPARRQRGSLRRRAGCSVVGIAAIGSVLTTSVLAETARIWTPNQAVSVHEGPFEVVAFWSRSTMAATR